MAGNVPASSSGLSATAGPPNVAAGAGERAGAVNRWRRSDGAAGVARRGSTGEVVGEEQAVGRSGPAVTTQSARRVAVEAVVDAADVRRQGTVVRARSRRCGPACRPRSGSRGPRWSGPAPARPPRRPGSCWEPISVSSSSGSWVSRLSPRYQTDAAEVAEHAEVVRHALRGHVLDGGAMPCAWSAPRRRCRAYFGAVVAGRVGRVDAVGSPRWRSPAPWRWRPAASR